MSNTLTILLVGIWAIAVLDFLLQQRAPEWISIIIAIGAGGVAAFLLKVGGVL